jgi:hypothetical protein
VSVEFTYTREIAELISRSVMTDPMCPRWIEASHAFAVNER